MSAALSELPAMSPDERADLEREAGRPFASDEAAYKYLRRKLHSSEVDAMLRGRR